MDLKINGKRALITGGSGGLAAAAARVLHEEGVKITLTDMDESDVKAQAEQIGSDVEYMAADLTKTDHIDKLADAMKDKGGIDILVHAAGVTGEKGDPLEMTDDEYRRVWETNFMSAVRLAKRMIPQMVDKGWGRMVCVTSENAVQPYWDEAVYNTSKAALLNFIKGASFVYGPKGVLMNTVSPAFIESPMTDGMMEMRAEKMGVSEDKAVETFLEEERPYLTLKRRGQPDEVAAVIGLLCSDRATFTNGSAYRVDGGAVAAINT
ncbi:4-formylbenzenesulfonate dehydrogenase TsaC1/TsaC2 [Rhodobacteraceae bacterium THAF1]|uniref:SDR family NAD(P)-dependent oxidoreductase n=1 Tax=Palleronia sp. THAF1 TaxID=2587842 RepID=UPI000F3FC972|nr:SDR family oxidoreductase [Palleronia sp. THAF1]QFU09937.1 4-formylbenzenesulfonate dehydrogenase TsaC1/TsaC2 [Palleronia sp. THAF1]VDC17160.1 4-formylbenzenesulfonate dehydrogenase TsaC1/TsaC2 [Rhodobacteraceae bacterium THAF1]